MAKKHKAAPKLDVSKHVTRRRLARWEKERRRRRIYTTAGMLVIVLIVVIVVIAFVSNTTEEEMWVTSVGDIDFYGGDYVDALYLCQLGLYNATNNESQDPILLLETSELVRQGAEGFGIGVTDTELTQVIKSMFETENQSLTDEEFQQAYQQMLSNLGVADKEFRELIEVELLQLKLDQYLRAQIPNSTVHVYLEAISTTNESEALVAGTRIHAGENFSSVGQEYEYNVVGWLPRGIMSPDIEEVAFSLEVGGVSDPIHISNPDQQIDYYSILKVGAKEKRPIEEDFRQQLEDSAYPGWFAMQRDQKVERNPNLDIGALYEWAVEQLIEQRA